MGVLGTGKKITIVGLGLTGYACARYLYQQGIDFRIVDSRSEPPMKSAMMEEMADAPVYCGEFDDKLFVDDDLLIVSPGLSLQTQAIQTAMGQGTKVVNDIALFIEAIEKPVVAITGSNGKSTVTMLLVEMLKNADMNAVAAGNIGVPVMDLLTDRVQADVYVLELSSFQLELLDNLSANAATVLNITEDHMDRYADIIEYAAVKRKIYNGAGYIVINRQDTLTHCKKAHDKECSFGVDEPVSGHFGLKRKNGVAVIAFGEMDLLNTRELKIKGRHNHLNVMAAMALSQSMTANFNAMIAAATSFSGLPHRCQWVGEYQGVAFYNDSKATNTGAAIAAIEGLLDEFSGIVLIAGGQDKDSDFSMLGELVRRHVRHLVLIGRDARKLEKAAGSEKCIHAVDMRDAVEKAFELSLAGDVVLLAPACASFDMFDNYQHRGEVFTNAVQALSGRAA